MADTARYNAASALPRQNVTELPNAEGGRSTFMPGRSSGGWTLEWEDLPCNWVREHWFEHRRRFTSGPLATLDARLDLTAPERRAASGVYRLEATPRGLARSRAPGGRFLRTAERMFSGLAAQADRFARGERRGPVRGAGGRRHGAARARLDGLAQTAGRQPLWPRSRPSGWRP